MAFLSFCKAWVKAQLEARGVMTVWTQAEANANYQVPKSAIVLVSDDRTERTPEKVERFVGTKDQQGHYIHDGRLHAYRSARVRKLTLEASIIGPSEAWVDGVIDTMVRDIPMRLKQTAVELEPGSTPETDDVWMDVDVPEIRWHDDESLLRNLDVGQIYIEFRRPYFKVALEPHWEEAEMAPNLTTDI